MIRDTSIIISSVTTIAFNGVLDHDLAMHANTSFGLRIKVSSRPVATVAEGFDCHPNTAEEFQQFRRRLQSQ